MPFEAEQHAVPPGRMCCFAGISTNRDRITEKWSEKYPNAMKRWERDWDVITPIFKFSADVRTVIYTTNAIESLNATYRKLNRQRSCSRRAPTDGFAEQNGRDAERAD